MAVIAGVGGNVTLPADWDADAISWSADLNVETVDTTSFAGVGYRSFKPTIISMNGSVEAQGVDDITKPVVPVAMLAATADLTKAEGSITLTAYNRAGPPAAVGTFTFDAVMTKAGMRRPNDGKLEVTYDFLSSGAITEVWT